MGLRRAYISPDMVSLLIQGMTQPALSNLPPNVKVVWCCWDVETRTVVLVLQSDAWEGPEQRDVKSLEDIPEMQIVHHFLH